jgi:phage baseplate assembly protein W
MDQAINTFLGRGWTFPPSFDRINNANQMASDLTDIEESIRIILGTTPGERMMQPQFGCQIKRVVFEQISSNLVMEINHVIGNALLNFEPRIKFLQAVFLDDVNMEGLVHIRIDYSIITTNTRHNIVYPFYIAEGTNVF